MSALNAFKQAFFAEMLKTIRSKVPPLTLFGLSLGPLVAGLFMVILKDPERARRMGMLGAKARLAGNADWPSFFGLLSQMIAMGGTILFAFVAAWVFGREFADRSVRLMLAVPTSRSSIVSAKFAVVALWCSFLSAWVFFFGLFIGKLVHIPGFSPQLAWIASGEFAGSAGLTILLLSVVAFMACVGRGYLFPLGFAFFTLFIGQISAAMGWGAWCPWSIPAIFSGAAGPRQGLLETSSYLLVAGTSILALIATFAWWRRADQST